MINPLHLFYPIDLTTTNPPIWFTLVNRYWGGDQTSSHCTKKDTRTYIFYSYIAHAVEENHLIATTILENATFEPPIARTWQELCSQVSVDNDDIAKLDRLLYAISHHYKNGTREEVAYIDGDFQHMINPLPVHTEAQDKFIHDLSEEIAYLIFGDNITRNPELLARW